jgi:hypothetical protein
VELGRVGRNPVDRINIVVDGLEGSQAVERLGVVGADAMSARLRIDEPELTIERGVLGLFRDVVLDSRL